MGVQHVESDGDFPRLLNSAGAGLAVVDFFATWCGPCQRIAPFFEQLSNNHPSVTFLKVDVDKCPETAAQNEVRAMPTFVFFVNKAKMELLTGANPQVLENKVKEWVEKTGSAAPTAVPGQIDLSGMISKAEMECLNEDDNLTLRNHLEAGTPLSSDCDEQLIINLPFTQGVKIHSIVVKGPPENGPKTVKLFLNNPRTLDFDQAEAMEPVQEFTLTPEQLESGDILGLRYVKFQKVLNLQIFVQDNVGGTDKTVITELKLFGSPIAATNMNEFKRVAGKKGESHD